MPVCGPVLSPAMRLAYVSAMLTDLRLALRGLRRAPAFSFVTILTLAVGIGGTSAVLALINAVLLEALPFREPEQLVFVRGEMRREGVRQYPLSYLDVESMSRESGAIAGALTRDVAAVTGPRPFNLTAGDGVEHVSGEMTGAPYLRVLGARVAAGRWFSPDEASPPGQRVVVLGHDLWQRRFDGNLSAIGTTILLNEQPYTIIGVAAEGFTGISDDSQLWLPLGLAGAMYGPHYVENREFRWLSAVARIQDGPYARFTESLAGFSRRLEATFPKENGKFFYVAQPMTEAYFGALRKPLYALLGGAILVLLIACTNVANLMLVRATARQRDTAVRVAMGAGSGRLVRAAITEMAAVGGLAALLGVVIAAATSRLIVASGAVPLASFVNVRIDPLILIATSVLGIGCAIAFGAAPLFLASRAAPASVLGEGSRGNAGGRGRRRAQRTLVAVQVAVALMLLVGAGLITRGFAGFLRTDLGFQPDGLLTTRVDLIADRYKDNGQYFSFVRALLDDVRRMPGVDAAAVEGPGYPTGGWFQLHVRPERSDAATSIAVRRHHVSPGYFDALGVRRIEGRDFDDSDVAGGDIRNVVVSKSLAERTFPGGPAVGQRLKTEGGAPITLQVVGVVDDLEHSGLGDGDETKLDVYLSVFQSPARSPAILTLLVRSDLAPVPLAAALATRLEGIDRNVAFYNTQTMRERLDGQTSTGRFLMVLMTVFGLLGLLLAAVGVYGVISYGVAQRTREIGVHIALGAGSSRIVRDVVISALVPVAAGTVIGLAGVAMLHRFVSSLLYGMSPMDPLTIAAALSVIALAAITASGIPARRASRIDPAVALRAD